MPYRKEKSLWAKLTVLFYFIFFFLGLTDKQTPRIHYLYNFEANQKGIAEETTGSA